MLKALVGASLRNRVITLVVALAVCVYGWISARGLGIDVLPDINRPTVSVLTEAPGLAAEEVEARVTAPIEGALSGAAGVQRVRSDSGPGLSVVHVEYAWGTDVYRARQVVQERLAEVRERIAPGVTPIMGPISSIMGEIMLVGVAGDGPDAPGPMEQRELAEWTVRPALLSVPGVAQVTVMGGEVRQVQVKADPDRLRLYGVTIEDLERAVAAASAGGGGGGGGGFLVTASTELAVRSVARARTVRDVEEALVATRSAGEGHAAVVRVKDVARVVEGPSAVKRGEASMMGRPAVLMAITKQPGADTRALTAAIEGRLGQLRGSLPPGVRIDSEIFRQSWFIEGAVGNVVEALRDGAVLVVIVLVLFLMNARVTLITLTALPLSILSAFIVLRLTGQSVNTMTLGGIAIAVGELVDDAVVGVENIFRRLRERAGVGGAGGAGSALRTVYEATAEVRGPILISTTIVLLVFLPLFFLPGLAGRLFTPLAQAYIVSIAASMVVSLTVTPVLSWYLLRREGTRAPAEQRGDGPVLRGSKRAALWAYGLTLGRPWTVVGVCVALVALAGVGVTRLGSEFLPAFNEGTAVVSVTAAPGVSLPESDRMGRAAEALALEVPEVKRVARRTGRAERDEHALGVNATELEIDFFRAEDVKAARKGTATGPDGRAAPTALRPRKEVFAEIRRKLQELPGVNVSVGQPIGHRIEHLESGVEAQVAVKIFGPELSRLRGLAERARGLIEGVAGTTDISVERQVLVPQVRVTIDPERAARYGFSVAELADTLETAVSGKVVGEVVRGLRSYDLVVMLDDPWRAGAGGDSTAAALKRLGEVRLASASGAVALVSDVCEIQEHLAPNAVSRENGQRKIVVGCNVQGRDLGTAVEEIERELRASMDLPAGYTLVMEGQHESQRASTRTIVWLGGLSLAAMLAILWSHFGSLGMAAQVMLNIPFAFIGAVATLLIFREPFSVASMVGFISLCGIAARNGVLMVSHYIHLMTEEGRPLDRETVVRGSQERVAPVLMTALTTGLAMLPLILNREAPGKEVLYPVALVVLGGLVTSTLLDFFVTPTVFLNFSGRAAARLVERYHAQKRAAAEGRGGKNEPWGFEPAAGGGGEGGGS